MALKILLLLQLLLPRLLKELASPSLPFKVVLGKPQSARVAKKEVMVKETSSSLENKIQMS